MNFPLDMCFVQFSEEAEIISPYRAQTLPFVMGRDSVSVNLKLIIRYM